MIISRPVLILSILITLIAGSCKSPLPTAPIEREIIRPPLEYTTVGSVEITEYSKKELRTFIAYDQLIQQAEAKYGVGVDVIEIKKTSYFLRPGHRRVNDGFYKYKYVFNALVIEYH